MGMNKITTLCLDGKIETTTAEIDFEQDIRNAEMELISIYPEVEFQTFEGFGGAFTESAANTLSRMSNEVYETVIKDYFGAEGLGYSFCRAHLDSCDFSLGNYSAVNDEKDVELNSFTLDRDEKYILPMIRKAQQVAKNKINFILSPWSPPAYMKTNGQKNGGGKLKLEFAGLWAKYIAKYIKEYRNLGVDIVAITVQNEPMATQTWDSCIFTAKEEGDFVAQYLVPQLKADGLSDIEIFIWDHNKESAYDRAKETLAIGNNREDVAGIAFHWYSGDHFEALDIIRKQFPEKKLFFTEGCVEYSRFAGAGQLKNAQMYAHDILGNLNGGMNAFIDWNLVLDEKGGPNHVGNYCDAPIMCDTINNTYEKKLSYVYIGHFSKYIKPGAVRIGYSKYTAKLEVTAFKNVDGSIVIVVLNRSTDNINYNIRVNGGIVKLSSEASSITTLVI